MSVLIFHYDENGIFLGCNEARLDPIEKKPLIPARATLIEPPLVNGTEYTVFDEISQKWQIKIHSEKENESFQEDLISLQVNAIDRYILQQIKKYGDYDSIGEVAAYFNSDDYGVEAKAVFAWIEQCHQEQFKLKNGLLCAESVDAAILMLPPLSL